MKLKTLGIGAMVLLSVFTMVMANVGQASAHYVYELAMIYKTNEDCVDGYSEVSHGQYNKGYSLTKMGSKYNYNGSPCMEAFNRPAGYLKQQQKFQFQAAPGIANCRDTGWIYNTTKTSALNIARHHNGNCGSWNYRTEMTTLMLNGFWKGGVLSSGFHYIY